MSTPKSVLAIFAHPDDAELLFGGTIAKWARAGADITFVSVTSGDKGTKDPKLSPFVLADMREKEQQEAARLLGVRQVVFLRKIDGEVDQTPTLPLELAMLIRHFRPQVIVSQDPWWDYDFHPDHRAVGWAVVKAITIARDYPFYPVLHAVGLERHRPETLYLANWATPDHVEDIGDFLELKLRALGLHKSQMIQFPGWEERVRHWCEQVARDEPFSYGEGFRVLRVD